MTAMSEDDFQTSVMDYAHVHHWRVCHVRPCRTSKGWRTAIQGDPGLPDLILARNGVVLLAEIKSATGGFQPGQREWLEAAGENGFLWRPADWPTVMEVLR